MTASLKTWLWHPPLILTIDTYYTVQYAKKGGGAMLRQRSTQE